MSQCPPKASLGLFLGEKGGFHKPLCLINLSSRAKFIYDSTYVSSPFGHLLPLFWGCLNYNLISFFLFGYKGGEGVFLKRFAGSNLVSQDGLLLFPFGGKNEPKFAPA